MLFVLLFGGMLYISYIVSSVVMVYMLMMVVMVSMMCVAGHGVGVAVIVVGVMVGHITGAACWQ